MRVIPGLYAKLPKDSLTWARAAFVAALAALPISTAMSNVCLGLGVLAWLVSGTVASTSRLVISNRAATMALALFCLLTLSMAWSAGPLHDQFTALGKFRKLLLIPIVASLFDDVQWRVRAAWALGLAIGLTLLLSLGSGLTGYAFPVQAEFGFPNNAIVFKQHITQNWLMSLFAFSCLCFAVWVPVQQKHQRAWQAAFVTLGLLAFIDIFGFVIGRTGQITALVLIGLWWILFARWRGVMFGTVSLVLIMLVLLSTHSAFKQRFELAVTEFEISEQGTAEKGNSIGERMAFWTNTATLIEGSPFIGYGLGSTQTVYRPLTQGQTGAKSIAAWNPHNEYLNLSVQAGIGATLLFISLLVFLARAAWQTEGVARWLGCGLALQMATSCLMNSSLWDFNEGHVFALLAGLLIAASRRAELA
jgi:O-antigen ligase